MKFCITGFKVEVKSSQKCEISSNSDQLTNFTQKITDFLTTKGFIWVLDSSTEESV